MPSIGGTMNVAPSCTAVTSGNTAPVLDRHCVAPLPLLRWLGKNARSLEDVPIPAATSPMQLALNKLSSYCLSYSGAVYATSTQPVLHHQSRGLTMCMTRTGHTASVLLRGGKEGTAKAWYNYACVGRCCLFTEPQQ